MTLKVSYPLPPMEAKPVKEIPQGAGWAYEPKWDGFRCLAFRDGRKIQLQSKAGKPLDRYFPELLAALKKLPVTRFVLDGEIVIPQGNHLSFDALLMRIHPAASRIRTLSEETPADYIVFDLLADKRGNSLLELTWKERRKQLEEFFAAIRPAAEHLRLSPISRSIKDARRWLRSAGAKLDGVVAKLADHPYESGNRLGMQKIKLIRTVDCVVGGFRYATEGKIVGSLLLGLYDVEGLLHHVGFTSSLKADERRKLTPKLKRMIAAPGFTGRAPGGPSRWSTERSGEWEPLRPELVVEVKYDHFTGGRFRHGTTFLRWRPDKAPRQCKLDQVTNAKLKLKK